MSGKDTGPPTRSPYSGSASFLHSTPGGGEIHDLMQRSLRIKNTLFLFRTGIAMGRETKTGYKNEELDRGRIQQTSNDQHRKRIRQSTGFRHGILFRRARYCPLRGIIRFQYRGTRFLYRQHPRGTIHHALPHHPIHGRRNLFPHPRGGTYRITRSVRIYLRGLYRRGHAGL